MDQGNTYGDAAGRQPPAYPAPSQPISQQPYLAGYPYQAGWPPAPKRRTGLIAAVIVGCCLPVLGAVGLGIGLSNLSDTHRAADTRDSERGGADTSTTATDARPAVRLPPGCELLTPAQVAEVVPGELAVPAGSGPDVIGTADTRQTQTKCQWTNNTPSLEPLEPFVIVRVLAVASVTEIVAEATYDMHCPERLELVYVSGADEACVENEAYDSGDVWVAAYYQTVVVSVHYYYEGKLPSEVMKSRAVQTTAAVVEMLQKS